MGEIEAALTPNPPGTKGKHWQIGPSARTLGMLALLDKGESQSEVARRYKVTRQTVSILRKKWRPKTDLSQKRKAGLDTGPASTLECPPP